MIKGIILLLLAGATSRICMVAFDVARDSQETLFATALLVIPAALNILGLLCIIRHFRRRRANQAIKQ
jgi:hypothetical protein